jgi:hypothetical protein
MTPEAESNIGEEHHETYLRTSDINDKTIETTSGQPKFVKSKTKKQKVRISLP